MVVVCSKRRTVQERADEEDRGRSFKISLCRRGSASIAAESGRREGNPPTKSRQQHHKPHHGRPKSRTKTIQNRSKMCRKSSPNRSGTLKLAKIALGRFLKRYFGSQKCARAAPRAVLGCPGAAKSAWKTLLGAPRTLQKTPEGAPEMHLEPVCLGKRRPRCS